MSWLKEILSSSGFWTALATVVIAAFTVELTCVSNRQWQTAQRQLDDSENAQAANLVVEDFNVTYKVEPTMGNGGTFDYDGSFTVRNAGGTVATELNIRRDTGTGRDQAGPTDYDYPPAPVPSGAGLAPDKTRTYKISGGSGPADKIMNGKAFFNIEVAVSYRDIFNRAHITADCLLFSADSHTFSPCENRHEHK